MDLLTNIFAEQLLIYGVVGLFCLLTVFFYLRSQSKKSKLVDKKVEIAKEEGLFEPVSLHPYIDLNTCIGSGACVSACPEKDILGISNGKATVINTTNCIGHGACFHACPVEAIKLRIGTETRGVDLPHVNETFESNIRGIYIAGELGGMGLIKNSVEQGQQAVNYIAKANKKSENSDVQLIIVGAGPAGISASLEAKRLGITSMTLEQDSLGGTVYTFPRDKIIMTAPMDLPLYGKVKFYESSKDQLLELWKKVIGEHNLDIKEHKKVEDILPKSDGTFQLTTSDGETYITDNVLLAIGRRGTPRKLNVQGEESQKVYYRLLEPERISDKDILVVGGGDSAIESAMLLMENNRVTLSYRSEKFSRLKPKNREKILQAEEQNTLSILYSSNVLNIKDNEVELKINDQDEIVTLPNNLVYIFAGGELPTKFLQKAGVEISKRFGYVVKKHK